MTLTELENKLDLIADQMDAVKKMLEIAPEDTHSEQKEKRNQPVGGG